MNGQVLYTPHLDYNGSDSFSYTIVDQNGATSNVATVIVNVTGVNDLPVAAKDTAIVAEAESVDIDVLANDSDVDGTLQNTRVQVLSNPANGTTSVDALTGVITYTPTANFHGSDTFTYVVQDNDGGTAAWDPFCPPEGEDHHYSLELMALPAPAEGFTGDPAADVSNLERQATHRSVLTGTYSR